MPLKPSGNANDEAGAEVARKPCSKSAYSTKAPIAARIAIDFWLKFPILTAHYGRRYRGLFASKQIIEASKQIIETQWSE